MSILCAILRCKINKTASTLKSLCRYEQTWQIHRQLLKGLSSDYLDLHTACLLECNRNFGGVMCALRSQKGVQMSTLNYWEHAFTLPSGVQRVHYTE